MQFKCTPQFKHLCARKTFFSYSHHRLKIVFVSTFSKGDLTVVLSRNTRLNFVLVVLALGMFDLLIPLKKVLDHR